MSVITCLTKQKNNYQMRDPVMSLFENKLINFMAYQLGWFICVVGAANGYSYYAILYVFTVVVVYVLIDKQPLNQLSYVLLIAFLGFLIDSLFTIFDIVVYESISTLIAPAWIVALWAVFAITIGHSLSWLADKNWLSMMLGLIFGPVAYFAAEKIGAVNVVTDYSYIAIAMVWSIFMPMMFLLYKKVYLSPKFSERYAQ